MAVYDYTLADGTTEKVSLSMAALFNLQRHDPKLYARYKQLYAEIGRGEVDDLVMAETIYIAYRAANTEAECMTFEEFVGSMTDSRTYMAEMFSAIFGEGEKKQVFAPPSGKRQGRGRRRR